MTATPPDAASPGDRDGSRNRTVEPADGVDTADQVDNADTADQVDAADTADHVDTADEADADVPKSASLSPTDRVVPTWTDPTVRRAADMIGGPLGRHARSAGTGLSPRCGSAS